MTIRGTGSHQVMSFEISPVGSAAGFIDNTHGSDGNLWHDRKSSALQRLRQLSEALDTYSMA